MKRLILHRDFRIVVAFVLLAGSGLAGVTWHLNRQVARLEQALAAVNAERVSLATRVDEERRRAQSDKESLENRIEEAKLREDELRERLSEAAGNGEVRAVRDELYQVRSRLVGLEGERAVGERIIREYGAGVCLIQGAYAFYDEEGRPLRYRVDKSGEKVREEDGSFAVGIEGDGPIHSVDAIGTGFLADKRGFVVTNRHVVEPWWKNATAEALEKSGYKARLLTLRAFFPRIDQPLKLEVHRVSKSVDLAVLKVERGKRKIPTLPLDGSMQAAVAGQPVVVVGYPTGLEAILAKAEGDVVRQILNAQGTSSERVTEALSRRGLIRPSTTQGHIGDVTTTDIVFDAATTQGGSGGPVFNKFGRVIAIEYATLPAFTGNSYGLPVRYVLDLIEDKPRS